MISPRRDIMVIVRNEFMSQRALESEIRNINSVLFQAESLRQFCISHELVDRNRITSKENRIQKLFRKTELGTFRFLICKN
jgi:hypothetical protein